MPGLRAWRHIIANAVSAALAGDQEPARPFPVYPFAPAKPAVTPCALIQQGGNGGPYLEHGDSEHATLCQRTLRLTVWIATGDPLTERAADLFDDLVTFLHSSAFAATVTADPLNVGGYVPTVGAVGTPGASELGGTPVWWADVELLCPAHL